MYLVNQNFTDQLKSSSSIIYLIAVGFFSILGQVVVLRELNVTFFGIELIYILSFTFWLLGTAIGAAVGRRSFIPKEKNIHALFLLSTILLIVDIIFIRDIRNIFGGIRGGYLPFLIQLSALSIALLPIGFLAGFLFQWTAKRFVIKNETLAKAYAIESAGGVLGGLSSTLFLDLGISNFSIALLCSLCFAFIVIYYSFYFKISLMIYISVAVSAGILLLFVFSHQIDMLLTSWNHPYMIESIDTPYNRVTLTSHEKQLSIFEDDALSYETQSIAAEEFVQLSTLQTTNFKRVLVLGGGFWGIVTELLKLPVEKIDYVEINKKLIDVLQKHLSNDLKNSLTDERVNLIYDDPRKFLKEQYSYEIILVGMPEPASAQNNRFYTQEFFKQCFDALTEEGIIAFKIRSSENIWTRQMTKRNSAIFNVVKSSFGNALVLPGVTNIFAASKSKIITDPNFLIKRFNARNLETKLVTPQYINYIFTNDRFAEIQQLLLNQTQIINSDLHPVCYSYTISFWLSKFFPNLAYSENPLMKIGNLKSQSEIYIVLIIVIGIFFIARKFIGMKRFVFVLAAGFIGMILEIILILLYQNKNGILFRDIGILLMMFMVGLSVGSLCVNKFFVKIYNQKKENRILGTSLLLGFALLTVIVYFFIKADLIANLVFISAVLLLDGMFVAGIFSFVSLYKVENQQAVISQLYTADLIGGSLGSLLASLVLIPVFGFYTSLIMMIILIVCCLIFVF
jgi:spermidine synthase